MQTTEDQKVKSTPVPSATSSADSERLERWIALVKANQRNVLIGVGALAVVAGGVWFTMSARERRESFARRELDQARVSAEAGNLPLAANDLSRIIATYSATGAGQEAVLLLAQVRLLQDQAPLAVAELQRFVSEGPAAQYRSPAHRALGAALEQTGQYAEAGRAYEDAARTSEYDLLAAQALIEAGRAYTLAGDTPSAIRVYEQLLQDYADAPANTEARLRMAELGKYDSPTTR
jgi:tetratricopeptide (TPR) repeat protein